MFWSKKPPPSDAPDESTAAEARNASADLDAAIDTLVEVLRIYGRHAFDITDQDAKTTAGSCETWAQRISIGESRAKHDDDDGEAEDPAKSFRRDWGGVRLFFSQTRSSEHDYVTKTVADLREAIHTFARCVTSSVMADRVSDESMVEQASRMSGALRDADSSAVRRECELMVSMVSEASERRRTRERAQLESLAERVQLLKAELKEARTKASLDGLTQLHNRATFEEHLARVSDLSFLMSSSPCLLLLDVDNFKAVNDTYGHPAGDEVLRRVADTLVRHFLRKEDFVARYGGEEFAIVVPDSSQNTAHSRAERVREAVEKLRIAAAGQNIAVTISVGMAAFGHGDSSPSWLARADAALYEAKSSGRNRVVIAPPPGARKD